MKPFKETLASGDFIVTVGLVPPKGTDLTPITSLVDDLKQKVHGIAVSDNSGSAMSISSWAAAFHITQSGAEAIMTISCRDRNRMALQSDLLGASFLKIRNVLCVSGDHISFGDQPEARPVYDIDSVQLLKAVRDLINGQDMTDHELMGGLDFCVGAVINPEADPLAPQFLKFKKKVRAGVDFLLTHPIFSPEKLSSFMEELKGKGTRLIAGVRLLVPEEADKYQEGAFPGLFVPDNLITEIRESNTDKGVEIAARVVKQIKEKKLCDGVHISAPGREKKIIEILQAANI